MNFEWKESSSYLVGAIGMLYDKLPHTCEGLTNLFALFIVVTTFFFITIPHALEGFKKRKKKGKKKGKNE
jgi:hypothetical protein